MMMIITTWAECWLSCLPEHGCNVSLVTPAPLISYWSQFTLEQERIQHKLMKLGVKLYPQHVLSEIENDCVRLIEHNFRR